MNEDELRPARTRQEQRLHRRHLGWEVARSVLSTVVLALLGYLASWGWQHEQREVIVSATIGGLAALAVFWMTYLRQD